MSVVSVYDGSRLYSCGVRLWKCWLLFPNFTVCYCLITVVPSGSVSSVLVPAHCRSLVGTGCGEAEELLGVVPVATVEVLLVAEFCDEELLVDGEL